MYIHPVKLTLKLKLKPTAEQEQLLIETIKEANSACNAISNSAWESKVFNQFKLHKQVYHSIRGSFNLSSQMVIRCISKISDSYKLDKKSRRVFNELGSISYDNRILSYKPNNTLSIWTVKGRQNIKYVNYNPDYIFNIKGESKLAYIKDKFYILQTIDVEPESKIVTSEFIGVDMGITDIATISTGRTFSSKQLNAYRIKRQKVRSSLQAKGTKGSKRVLKRLAGKERRTNQIINHTISKQIVQTAKEQGKGLVVENLKGIRRSLDKFSKKQKGLYHKWAFYDLRCKIEYKAERSGVPLIVVDPRYSSKTCSCCNHIGNRRSKSFKCLNCGLVMDADINASINLSTMGAVINRPEDSIRLSCELGLKLPILNR